MEAMVEFGPISLLAVGFPDIRNLKGELLKEIFKLSDANIIRIVGLSAIVKDGKGKVTSAQLTEFSDDERIKLGAGIGALIGLGAAGEKGAVAGADAGAERVYNKGEEFGLNPDQIRGIARDMPMGTAAGLLLIEHLWAKEFKEIGRKLHGSVLANAFITPESLVALGTKLADGARAAEMAKVN
jgi:uncharacterized membrane protein